MSDKEKMLLNKIEELQQKNVSISTISLILEYENATYSCNKKKEEN